MDIYYKSKDQNWADETTIYWFDVGGQDFGLADNNGRISLLDHEGYPIEECNDHNQVKSKLLPLYQAL